MLVTVLATTKLAALLATKLPGLSMRLWSLIGLLVSLCLVLPSLYAQGTDTNAEVQGYAEGAPTYYVLIHSPGPAWQKGVEGTRQPGIEVHVEYMSGLLEKERLLLGGPFLDDSGGIMILTADSLEEAETMARADPAVRRGLLNVVVKPWLATLSNIRVKRKRKAPSTMEKGEPFKLQPLDPDAPINIKAT